MTLAAIDLGSRYLGIVAGGPSILAAETIRVDDANLAPCVASCMTIFQAHGVKIVVVETGRMYVPPTAPPQAAAAMGQAFAIMGRLLERLMMACETVGIVVVKVTRATWCAWLCGSATKDDGDIRRELRARLPAETMALLRDAHQRDAAGLWLWGQVPHEQEERKAGKGKHRPKTEAQKKRNAMLTRQAKRAELNAKRVARGEPPKVYRDGPHPSDLAFAALLAEHEAAPQTPATVPTVRCRLCRTVRPAGVPCAVCARAAKGAA